MVGNPFLDSSLVTPELERVARRLADARGLLPASTQTDSESYYSCAPGQDVLRTQEDLLYRTSVVCILGRLLGFGGTVLTPQLILQMHEGIFEPGFGSRTRRWR